MTKEHKERREKLAAMFMAAIIAKRPYEKIEDKETHDEVQAEIARGAVYYADALINLLDEPAV